MLSEIAFAKINLALHVRRRRGDGYHDIDTVFAFVDDGDILKAEIAPSDLSLSLSGDFAENLGSGPDNLVLRTASLIKERFKIEAGANIYLEKRLPIASGIGGGSADAAATARLLNKLWSINATASQLRELLSELGADIPACIDSFTVRGEGIGTKLTPLADDDVAGLFVLLVNPNQPVATGPIFAAWDGVDKGGLDDMTASQIITKGRNDLQKPAISLCPNISDILDLCNDYEPLASRMSGSGATCFALFGNQSECKLAADEIRNNHPEYWIMTGRLR